MLNRCKHWTTLWTLQQSKTHRIQPTCMCMSSTVAMLRQRDTIRQLPWRFWRARYLTNFTHIPWRDEWLTDWLEFNGTFSTVRLYRAFRSYSLRFGKQKHPGSLVHLLFSSGWPATYITPSSRIAFCSNWPLKGWSQLPTRSNDEGAKSSKGAHLSLLRQRHNMKGNDSTVQGKTKHTPT